MGTRWRGVLAPINQPTGDGRRMAPGAFTHRPLPLPLRWQRPETNGHNEAVTVGIIDTLRIDEKAGHVWGEGELFDDISPASNPRLAEDVAEAKYLLDKKAIGPSVDPGSATAVAVVAGTDKQMTDQQAFEVMVGQAKPPAMETLFTAYEIAGATLVPVPAFAQCRPFELDDADSPVGLIASEVHSSGWADLPIAPRDRAWDGDAARQRLAANCGLDGDSPDWDCYGSGFLYRYTDRDPHTRGAYSFPVVDIVDGTKTLIPAAVYAAANILSGGRGGTDIPAAKQRAMRAVVSELYARLADHFDDPSIEVPWGSDRTRAALVAAAGLGMPPVELFMDPQLSQLTPITRRPLPNGWTHIFGHLAQHETCLVGKRDMCLTPPYSEREYSSFHRYHQTDGGEIEFPLPLGRLTAGFGSLENTCRCCPGNDDHACANISFGAAVAHHDRMQALAYIRVGEDEANNAIWFSGVEAPGVDERGHALLRRQKISGDWREVAGSMELSEVLVLNRRSPGFPLPRGSSRGGRQRALTAAGVVHAPMSAQTATVSEEPVPEIDYDRLAAGVAEQLIRAADPDGEFGFNKNQRRGPDGRWIKMGGPGSAGGRPKGSEGGGAGAGGRNEGDDSLRADDQARRAERDSYNDAIKDLGMRMVAEEGGTDGPFEDDDDEYDEDAPGETDLDELGSALSDLEDAIMDGNRATADLLADEIAEMLRVRWLAGDRLPQRPGMTAAAQVHTGAMVALRMSEADAARLAVTGGEPPEQLHMTMRYLGDADKISPETRKRIIGDMAKYAASAQPFKADAFAVNTFNPGNANDRDTALVLGIGGDGLAEAHQAINSMAWDGYQDPAEAHTPWHPHVTLQYTNDMNRVKAVTDRIGPMTFDRLRLAFGGEVTDLPLGGPITEVGGGYDISGHESMMAADLQARARRAQAALAVASGDEQFCGPYGHAMDDEDEYDEDDED